MPAIKTSDLKSYAQGVDKLLEFIFKTHQLFKLLKELAAKDNFTKRILNLNLRSWDDFLMPDSFNVLMKNCFNVAEGDKIEPEYDVEVSGAIEANFKNPILDKFEKWVHVHYPKIHISVEKKVQDSDTTPEEMQITSMLVLILVGYIETFYSKHGILLNYNTVAWQPLFKAMTANLKMFLDFMAKEGHERVFSGIRGKLSSKVGKGKKKATHPPFSDFMEKVQKILLPMVNALFVRHRL